MHLKIAGCIKDKTPMHAHHSQEDTCTFASFPESSDYLIINRSSDQLHHTGAREWPRPATLAL